MTESIIEAARSILPDVVELRRALHRNPEVGLELPGTKTLVLEALAGLPLEIIEHEYGTSYRVAWDDGHESTFRPTAGTVHTVHPAESETD